MKFQFQKFHLKVVQKLHIKSMLLEQSCFLAIRPTDQLFLLPPLSITRFFKFCLNNLLVIKVFRYSFSEAIPIFSITLKVVFSFSDRYKILTSNWLWIENCENVVLSKIDFTMTTINKKTLKLIKADFCVIQTRY